jgi:probable phosphoglycerate mutase
VTEKRYAQRPFVRPPGTTEIVLVRHGASADAVPGVAFPLLDGHGDPPLSPIGEQQARAVGDRLAGEDLKAIFVSGLTRTVQTAQPLAAKLEIEPIEVPELREVKLGDWEGGEFRIRAIDRDPLAVRVIEEERWDVIPGAESMDSLAQRTRAGIDKIVARAGADVSVVAVAHGGVIGELARQATGSRPFAFIHNDNCSITRLYILPGGRWLLRSFNDSAHLNGVMHPTTAG